MPERGSDVGAAKKSKSVESAAADSSVEKPVPVRRRGLIEPKDWVPGEVESIPCGRHSKRNILAIRPESSWMRQPRESGKVYEYFKFWMELPAEKRTYAAVAKEFFISVQAVKNHSCRWFWDNRLRERNNHDESVRQKAVDVEAAKEAKKWAQRREKALDDRYNRSQKMFDLAQKMVDYPLTHKTVKERDAEGNAVKIEIRPSKWTISTAVRVTQVASVLEATSIAESLEFVSDFDPDSATPEECAEYLRKVRDIREKAQNDMARAFNQ